MSSYRPPSRPCSRYASTSRGFVNNVQPNSSENPDHYTRNFLKSKVKFGGNMYTTEMTNAITQTSGFYNL